MAPVGSWFRSAGEGGGSELEPWKVPEMQVGPQPWSPEVPLPAASRQREEAGVVCGEASRARMSIPAPAQLRSSSRGRDGQPQSWGARHEGHPNPRSLIKEVEEPEEEDVGTSW